MKKAAAGQWKGRRNAAPEAIADILKGALKSHHLEKKVEDYAGFAFWDELVGEEIARVAKPQRIIKGNVLQVCVIDAAWAQELTFMKPTLLDKIHKRSLGAVIEDLVFVTGNPKLFKR